RHADAVAQAGYANGLGAMLAAKEGAVLFESVADDADAAVLAGRRQRMDRALEAVEGVGGTVHAHLKRLVVVVSTGFTSGHGNLAPGCGFGGLWPYPRAGAPVPAAFAPPAAALLPAICAECGILAGKCRENPPAGSEPFVAPPRLIPRTPDSVSDATGAAGWVVMSVFRLAAGVMALAIGAAVVPAFAASPERKTDSARAAAVAAIPGPTPGPAAAAAAKSDRLMIRAPQPAAAPPKPAAGPVTSVCPQEPWPYGCQWRTPPARKVYRASRPG